MRAAARTICVRLLLALGLALPGIHARAQSPVWAYPAPLAAIGYCQLSVAASAVALTSCSGGIPARTAVVSITVSGANIRYRDDGTAPTTTLGLPLLQGQNLPYSGSLFSNLSFIAQSGTASIDIMFYSR